MAASSAARHGQGSFCWTVAEAAAKAGFWPDSLSTDLHVASLGGPVTATLRQPASALPASESAAMSPAQSQALVNTPRCPLERAAEGSVEGSVPRQSSHLPRPPPCPLAPVWTSLPDGVVDTTGCLLPAHRGLSPNKMARITSGCG